MLDCGGYSFTAKGKTVKQDGWKAVLSAFKASMKQKRQESDEEEATLPTLTVGQVLSDVQASVREGKTSPPKHFTEDSLLAAMETAGAEDMPEDAERKVLAHRLLGRPRWKSWSAPASFSGRKNSFCPRKRVSI